FELSEPWDGSGRSLSFGTGAAGGWCMRSMVAGACALLCLMGFAACVGSPEVVGSGGGQPGPSHRATTRSLEPARGPATEPYEGLGTWIDIHDPHVWERPAHAVRSMAAHGVRTIYLQSSNYHRNRPFVHAEGVEAIVDAANRRGLQGVGGDPPGVRGPP